MLLKSRKIFELLKKSYHLLSNANPLLLSAATAFFATFALSPILIILSHLLSLLLDEKVILPKLFDKINIVFGEKSTHGIRRIVENFLSLETNVWITVALSIFFYFIATTLLSAIRQSIHQLWSIQKKPAQKFPYHLKERLIEIVMILLIGVLFLFTLLIDKGMDAFQLSLSGVNHKVSTVLYEGVNVIFSIALISTWLTFVYRFMPEAKVQWKVAFAGGLFTGTLFLLGRIVLTHLLANGKLGQLFGPSSGIAMVLLLIFYCSFILYFGASFTFEYSKAIGHVIRPGKLGDKYEQQVVTKGMGRPPVKSVKV
ncbi:YihY/virulence factor BrkB family protein [Chryseolinea lacunae]|uniref:YihY/virulence factor BrkB family protein n=1 Tax=Chryseolinea lacunae TaxID=2801331 RepID=A0ABS1KRA9_9BACT|nr:YihY/virulence factor BrkB family protein [Chryseolinea lacunae]MBL0741971.1 YihY/virulence factor BrkB family protein [Chryseolinea lacunae]